MTSRITPSTPRRLLGVWAHPDDATCSRRGEWSTAVRLQTAADAFLDVIGHRLFPTDRDLCDTLLADAAQHLDPDHSRREEGTGSQLRIEDIIAQTREVLEASASAASADDL